jgi:tyrosyl-tRNA synthetase
MTDKTDTLNAAVPAGDAERSPDGDWSAPGTHIDNRTVHNQALKILAERGFLKQCSDLDGLEKRMAEGPVTLYVGTDPTGPSLHAGHMVPMFAVAHLARAGHRPTVLIGGGTARVGDPSGKTEMRKMSSYEEIDANGKRFEKQLSGFFERAGVTADVAFVNNADWLAGLNYIDFLRDIGRHFSVNRMLSFEAYKMRMETGLSFIEFNYQLLQSYDFLELYRKHDCQLQIGGDDQWGNIVAGIDLIRRVEGPEAESYALTFPLVTRSDGKKMGKTEKGAVFLDPDMFAPFDFFQYWRNVADADVVKFLKLFTFLPMDEIEEMAGWKDQKINEAKERLAYEFTALIHGKDVADGVLESVRAAFGSGASGAANLDSMPTAEVRGSELEAGIGILELFRLSGLSASNGEARRLVQQGGARINDAKVENPDQVVTSADLTDEGIILKAGKKRYARIIVK